MPTSVQCVPVTSLPAILLIMLRACLDYASRCISWLVRCLSNCLTDRQEINEDGTLPTVAGHFPGKASHVDSWPTLHYHSQFEHTVDVAGAPTEEGWYHGGISEYQAVLRIRIAYENGTYLVYDNPSWRGEYILLVYNDGELHRWRIIRRSDGMYVLGENVPGARTHDSVKKLIEYHRGFFGKPIMLANGRRVVLGDHIYLPL